jgi:dTDP-4-dehydrorhamnose reductase
VRILVTGAGGQLAGALERLATPGLQITALGADRLDITDAAAVERTVAALGPDSIVNAAAYTAVDRAESEPDLARRVNADGPGHLARAASRRGAFLVHVSTDFVFAGDLGRPYRPDDEPGPLSVYGRTKLEGERAVRAEATDAAIIRTAWVYAATGRNFLLTMLRLMRERGSVRVVADQVGSPTAADGLAAACLRAAEGRLAGTWHWTDAGVASWYDFAVAIAEEGLAAGLLRPKPEVVPIRTEDFPTPARRPPYSVLDKTSTLSAFGLPVRHWRDGLRGTIRALAATTPP